MVQLDDRRANSRGAGQQTEADVAHARRAAASFAPPRDDSPLAGLGRFARKYGWRAYALPILVVITILALLTTGGSSAPKQGATAPQTTTDAGANGAHSGGPTAPPVASGNTSIKQDEAGADVNNSVLASGALPPGPEYTTKGDGTFRTLKGTSPKVGSGRLYRYSVDVENGVTGVDVNAFAAEVQQVLSDKRSWAGHGDVTLQRVDSGKIDFHVTLTSSMTVRAWCGYDIPVETSCYASASDSHPVSRVVMNVSRWVRGSMAYVGDLAAYRIYMINHEDGHAIGHNHAHQCLPGGVAPVMLQQTIGLKSAETGKNCTANPWPYPDGVKGAPGAEQQDTEQNSEIALTGD
jgi:hypothetical protein